MDCRREKIYDILKSTEVPYEGVNIDEATGLIFDYVEEIIQKQKKTISDLEKGVKKLRDKFKNRDICK